MRTGECGQVIRLPYLLIILATMFWGSTGIAAEKVFALGLEPSIVVWYRVLICFIAVFLYSLFTNPNLLKIGRQDVPFFVLYGFVCVALSHFAYFSAVAKSGTAVAAILLYSSPAIVVLLSHFIFREIINQAKIVCILLTLFGCFLVVKGYDLTNLKLNVSGLLWGIIAGFCHAMFTILGKKSATKYHPLTLLFYGQGIGLIYLTIFAFPFGGVTVNYTKTVWFDLIYIGLVTSFLPNLFYNMALKHLEPGRAIIVATLEPVMAVVFAYLFLGHILAPVQSLGAVLVLLAVIIVQIPAKAFRGLSLSN